MKRRDAETQRRKARSAKRSNKPTVILNGVSPRAKAGAKRSEGSLTVTRAEAAGGMARAPTHRLRPLESAILHSVLVRKASQDSVQDDSSSWMLRAARLHPPSPAGASLRMTGFFRRGCDSAVPDLTTLTNSPHCARRSKTARPSADEFFHSELRIFLRPGGDSACPLLKPGVVRPNDEPLTIFQ